METISTPQFIYATPPSATGTKKRHTILKRISPFLILTVFLVFWFPFTWIVRGETTAKIIAFPGLIIYLLFGDFVIWNYLRGKKKWFIWILEGIVSALIVYSFV